MDTHARGWCLVRIPPGEHGPLATAFTTCWLSKIRVVRNCLLLRRRATLPTAAASPPSASWPGRGSPPGAQPPNARQVLRFLPRMSPLPAGCGRLGNPTHFSTYPDVDLARQQHDEAVQSDAEAARRRQPVLERHAELLVLPMRLHIAALLVLHSRTHTHTYILNVRLLLRYLRPYWIEIRTCCCAANRRRWSNGSFSSVYALHSSLPATKSSKRSVTPGCSRCVLASGLMHSGWLYRNVGWTHSGSMKCEMSLSTSRVHVCGAGQSILCFRHSSSSAGIESAVRPPNLSVGVLLFETVAAINVPFELTSGNFSPSFSSRVSRIGSRLNGGVKSISTVD